MNTYVRHTYFDLKSFVKYPLDVAPNEGFLYHLPPKEKPDLSLTTDVSRRHMAKYKFILRDQREIISIK